MPRSSSCLSGVAAGLALIVSMGCDRGAAQPTASPTPPPTPTPAPAKGEAGPPAPAPGATPAPAPEAAAEEPFVLPPNPNRLPPKPLIEPTLARLTLTEATHDFGAVSDAAKKRTTFEFVNTGPEPLIIADVKASCSCTVPALSKRRYEPGERGTIDVVFDPANKTGVTAQEISIISNSRDGVATLTVSADVRTLISSDRFARLGEMQLFEEHRAVVPLRYTDPELEFDEITVNDPFISAKLLGSGIVDSTEGGAPVYRADIELTVSRDHPWGGLFARRASITVTGRWMPEVQPIRHTYTIFLLGSVFGEIHAEPLVAAFGQTTRNQNLQKSIELTRPSGAPFKIKEAWVTDMRVVEPDVRIERIDASTWRVVLAVNTGASAGEIRGKLLISTDVPGEDLLEIPVSGRVG